MLVNGQPWEECQAAAGHMAGSYCTVEREFRAGAEQLPRIWSSHASCSHIVSSGAGLAPMTVPDVIWKE